MPQSIILICHWLPDGQLTRWQDEFSGCAFIDGRDAAVAAEHLPRVEIVYGLPDIQLLGGDNQSVKWIQLASAGVPAALCPVAKERGIRVTNLAGLYGPTIAEHALAIIQKALASLA